MEIIFSKDSNSGNSHIAFFDLDRTITKAISGKALARVAIKNGLMTRSDLFNAVYLSLAYKLNLKDPLEIMDKMTLWVKGMAERTLIDLCAEVCSDVLMPSVYAEARSEIRFHKDKNAKVVILSSALTPICLEIAKNLEIDDIICSDLEVKDGYLTGLPLGRLCFGAEKKVRLKDYCKKNNFKTSDAWYYGDSIADLAALDAVGNPVCINPDWKLKRVAHKRNWKILHWYN